MNGFIMNVIAGVVATAITAGTAFLFDGFIKEPLSAYPALIVSIACAAVILGICLGWLLRSLVYGKDKSNCKKLSRAEIEEMENRLDKEAVLREFHSLNKSQAALVSTISKASGGIVTSSKSGKFECIRARPDIVQFTNAQGNQARLNLTPKWNRLMNEHRDLFNEIWGEEAEWKPRRQK